MNIYSTLQIGDYHLNHCEDALVIKNIGSDRIIAAVMDGCSTAMESHFASTLVAKILRKTAIETGYRELYEPGSAHFDPDTELKAILQNVFTELNLIKNQLMLDEKELLTTLIIVLYHKKEKQGIVLTVGDGLICIDGEIYDYDRDNKPDYFAFHLKDNFNDWYASQTQKLYFNNIHDFSVATDGIFTLTRLKNLEHEEKIDVFHYLLKEQSGHETDEMLNKKMKKLENQFGMKPTDDLAIIRIIENIS